MLKINKRLQLFFPISLPAKISTKWLCIQNGCMEVTIKIETYFVHIWFLFLEKLRQNHGVGVKKCF